MEPTHVVAAEEEYRLRTLHHQDILHSLHEPIFTAFVKLTAHIFSLSISLISLTDAEETVYIAGEGVGELGRYPRAEAICSLIVREGKAVIFSDLTQVMPPRLPAEALAAARTLDLHFYAGVPLRMPDYRTIGTLCIVDQKPRLFSAQEQEVLEGIGTLIARIIVVRSYCRAADLWEARWLEVQTLLMAEINALNALVQHVITRSGVQIPVVPHILEPVMRRLQEVNNLLDDYVYGRP